ncbi:hypothetical protein MGG_11337 [Pyricularia oryzae 70-15]|uniref:Uncharacterized protein n=1 Tax=Pyricularia oryzae (strain 70-15 / ATCC MYA-4617 / FGSC 8958) TaxID=242507 RepID=G4MUN5_PYRO7|nr:uncharacterized protein MGG_11337 [Pyricularia oryzae 70-15]EHA54008.1 hypothetical protein MGG_11337 [Pyricularia oryzae 70-15]
MYPSSSDNSGLSSPGQANRPEFELAVLARWRNWVSSSSYSPWNLHYITPPRPNDLPNDMDESPNGWADAFEDLLRASSHSTGGPNLPLADHHERLRAARKDRVDHRNVDRRWLWLAGLRAEGLLGAAYPAGKGRSHAVLRDMASEAFGAHSSLPQTEEDVFLRFMKDSEDVLDVLPKAVGFVSDRDDSGPTGHGMEDPSRKQRTPGKHVSTEKFQNSDGTTTVVTREEKVDGKGNTRSVKTVTKTLDQEGNEISRSTESSYSRTWGGKWSWSTDDSDAETHDDGANKKRGSDDEPKKNFSSWLWK